MTFDLPVCGMLSTYPCRFWIICVELNCPRIDTLYWRCVALSNNSLCCSCPEQIGIIFVHFLVLTIWPDPHWKERHIHSTNNMSFLETTQDIIETWNLNECHHWIGGSCALSHALPNGMCAVVRGHINLYEFGIWNCVRKVQKAQKHSVRYP